MLAFSMRSWVPSAAVLLSIVFLRGDGCDSDPTVTVRCQAGRAELFLRPGYCAPVPNCDDPMSVYSPEYAVDATQVVFPDWLGLQFGLGGDLRDQGVARSDQALRACATSTPSAGDPNPASFTLTITDPRLNPPRIIGQQVIVTVTSSTTVLAPVVTIEVVPGPNVNTDYGRTILREGQPVSFRALVSGGNAVGRMFAWELDEHASLDESREEISVIRARAHTGGLPRDGGVLKVKVTDSDGVQSDASFSYEARTEGRVVLIKGPSIVVPYAPTDYRWDCYDNLWTRSLCSSVATKTCWTTLDVARHITHQSPGCSENIVDAAPYPIIGPHSGGTHELGLRVIIDRVGEDDGLFATAR